MNDSLTTSIYQLCKSLLVPVTLIALKFHGKVANDQKASADLSGTSQDQARVSAKTDIDELIQDVFLYKLLEAGMSSLISVDVEEDSGLIEKFTQNNELKLVIDPIDGTLNYIDPKNNDFSINIALISKDRVEFSFVAFPMFNALLSNFQNSYNVSEISEVLGEPFLNIFEPSENNQSRRNQIQYNFRTPESMVNMLNSKNLTTKPSNGLYYASIEILAGNCDALIAGTPMVRDIIMHEILAGLYPDLFEIYDYKGNSLNYFDGPRLSEFVFAKKGMRDLIIGNI